MICVVWCCDHMTKFKSYSSWLYAHGVNGIPSTLCELCQSISAEYFISSQLSRWMAICLDDLLKLNIYANQFSRIVWNQQYIKRWLKTMTFGATHLVYHVSIVSTCIPYKSILFRQKINLICKFHFLENSNSVNLHLRFTFITRIHTTNAHICAYEQKPANIQIQYR